MDLVIFSVTFAAIAAVVFLVAGVFDRRVAASLAILCAIYLGADDLITGIGSTLKGLDALHWNWAGKLLSLIFSAVVIVTLGMSPATVGLTFRQRHAGIGLLALVLFMVWGACLGFLFKPGAPDAETLAFQALMPGLSEELVYRGILPALLFGLIRGKGPIEGMPWAVILATAAVFGAVHGLKYWNGEFGFDVPSALFPFIGSIPGGWLRFKTGSLLIPVCAHGVANVAFHLAGGIAG